MLRKRLVLGLEKNNCQFKTSYIIIKESFIYMNINSRTSSGLRVLTSTNLVSPVVTNSIRGNGDGVSIQNMDTGQFNRLLNANGELLVNNVEGSSPLTATTTNGTAEIGIAIDSGDLYVTDEGTLGVIPSTVTAPIAYDANSRTTSLSLSDPLEVVNKNLALNIDS